mgnify:CR=1 FL=1|tara:strand:+ start:91 stop:708 length:618 start_codon:yes stop_codon:yes gene_type:complete
MYNNKSLMSAKDVKNKYQITTQTLYNWRKNGKINYIKLPSGSFMYYDIDINTSQPYQTKNVIYARVSNTKQKHDLESQISTISQYMACNGYIIDDIYQDIASGMNENRDGLNKLLNDVIDGNINNVFITYKDRLTRFGFGYIENMLNKYNTNIVTLNATREEDFQQELTEDLISVIHHFSMKMYSNRRKQLKELSKVLNKPSDNE